MLEAPYDYQFRLILIGDSTVGKSTLLKVLTTNNFESISDPTIGVDFFSKTIKIKNNIKIKLQLWDTAGQEKFRSITSSYYRNTVGVLFLFDICNKASFLNLSRWENEVRQNLIHKDVVYALVGTKSDQANFRKVKKEDAEFFANLHKMKYIETSSKLNYNVDKAVQLIAEEIYDKIESGEFSLSDYKESIRKNSNVNLEKSFHFAKIDSTSNKQCKCLCL